MKGAIVTWEEVEIKLRAAGFNVAREDSGHMVRVERGDGTAKILMDSGDTVRYAWDPDSISDRTFFFEVMEVVEGRERRTSMQRKIENEMS